MSEESCVPKYVFIEVERYTEGLTPERRMVVKPKWKELQPSQDKT